MMRSLFLAVSALCLVSACQQGAPSNPAPLQGQPAAETQSPQTESDRLNAWFEEKYEEELQFSPITLTQLGRKERYAEIDDFSLDAMDRQLDWRRQTAEEMQANFDYDALDAEARTSYDLWLYNLDQEEAGIPFRLHGYLFEQMGGVQSSLPQFLINFHRVDTEQDILDYIARIDATGAAMEQFLDRAKLAASQGIRPPAFAYDGAREQAEKVITGAPFQPDAEADSDLYADLKMEIDKLKDDGTISVARAEELRLLAKAMLIDQFQPAYENIVEWLAKDVANTGPEDGVWKLPDGEAFYNYRLKDQTTTTLSAEEIHQIGLAEVARIRNEMETIKDAVGFRGSLQDFFTLIRDSKDDPRFYYPNTDEGRKAYIDDATAAIENINRELPNYFGLLPKADLIVKRVEPFRERDGAAQHYFPGTPDGSRPGIYYAHLSDMTAMPKNQLEVIAYHEGNPGHHMQISIAQELEGVPTFRTQQFYNSYVEGWALYSELLAKEMPNTYQDPYSDFGRLTTEMWRAVRLVVDTGLHAKQWTRQEAIDYFAANTPEPIASIEAEIERYVTWPGQATGYKIGMIEIQRLRAKAEDLLGDRFDIKAFHDTVLGGGGMPLALLAQRVDAWIDRELLICDSGTMSETGVAEVIAQLEAKSCDPSAMTADCIPYAWAPDGCFPRAEAATLVIGKDRSCKVRIDGSGDDSLMATDGSGRQVAWDNHVAPVVFIEQPAGPAEPFVLDLALSDTPIPLGDVARFLSDPAASVQVVSAGPYNPFVPQQSSSHGDSLASCQRMLVHDANGTLDGVTGEACNGGFVELSTGEDTP